jgi:hypothetical protein
MMDLCDLAEILCAYDFPWVSEISLLRVPGLMKALSWEQDRLGLDALRMNWEASAGH